jgi:hypothetical protein
MAPLESLSNSTVEALLDLLEGRASSSVQPVAAPAPRSSVDSSVLEALRRLSTSGLIGGPTAAPEAHAPSPEPQMMPDIDRRSTFAPEAQEPSQRAERDKAHPQDADEPRRPSRIRPRLFPRATH